MRFRPEQHLRRQGDIRSVREQGRRVDCRAFTVWWKRREAPPANAPRARVCVIASTAAVGRAPLVSTRPEAIRVCVIASAAAVGAATRRNRAKRRLREVFRRHQDLVPAGCDLLLIARAAATDWPLAELENKFAEACRQIPPASPPA